MFLDWTRCFLLDKEEGADLIGALHVFGFVGY